MKILLMADGQQNPVCVNRENLRLSVKTEEISKIDKIEYLIYSSEQDFKAGKVFLSKTVSEQNAYFDGKSFNDCTEYFWQAKIHSGKNVYTSDLNKFETGIDDGNFCAKWIENPNFDNHVAEFEKTFVINEKVKKARLYIVGLGFYTSKINGVKTDDEYYKPVLTDFDIRKDLNNKWYNNENYDDGRKTVCYDGYDVTSLVNVGENKLNVLLGTGWYCDEDKLITDPSFSFGKPKLFFELRIETESGTQKVVSDLDCAVRNTHIISQHFACDTIDFSAEDLPFTNVTLAKAPTGKLVVNVCENDGIIDKLLPVEVKNDGNITEYDFGVNHTGGIRAIVKGKKGSTITFKYYETKKDGVLNPLTSRWDAYKDGKYIIGHLDQTCTYVLSGGEDLIEPYFHWSCYRYATIECDGEFEIKDVESLFISTDVAKVGQFFSEDTFLNRLYDVFILTQRDNMHCGVPSDCPHREKLPYTGDGQLAAEATLYTLDTENFYRKWHDDILCAQGKNGYVPNSAPYMGGDGGYWWTNALITVTKTLYDFTGDRKVLENALPHCIKLIKYYDRVKRDDNVVHFVELGWGLGDWLTPEVTVLNKDFMNTLAAYYAADITAEFCKILGVCEYDELITSLKEKTAAAINQNFFDKENNSYCESVQGADVLPLLFGICPEENRKAVLDKLIEKYEKDPHFDTGIVLTSRLLDLLTEAGRSDLAYAVLTEKSGPSYYDMLDGETTLCEHWYKHWPGSPNSYVSHCHPMFGSVISWIVKHVSGLDLTELGNKKIIYAPKVIDKVKEARASRPTDNGLASISYCAENGFSMKVCVPFGVSGIVRLPRNVKHLTVNGLPIAPVKKEQYIEFELSGGEHAILGEIM